jgi:CheY-like chemotaxis protein
MSNGKNPADRGNDLYLERMAILGEMFAEAAHEINNLLGAACAYLELEADERGQDTSRHVQVTAGLARLAADLTTNVLHFAGRVLEDAGDVRECVMAAVGLFGYRTRRGVEVETDVQDGLPGVTVSSGNLLLILINLVKNGLDALEGEPDRRLRVTARLVGTSVEIRVWNSGPPIPPKVLSRLFSKGVTTKHGTGGSGLGLSIARRLVMNAGGTIAGANLAGGGVTFTINLPVSATATSFQLADAQPAPEMHSASIRGRRILVVDDDQCMREVLQLVLNQMGGGQVETCASGEEALRLLKIKSFDAVVLDLRMPGLSGQSTFERMPPRVKRRVVFITGDALRSSTRDFLSVSRQPALIKPVAHFQLVEAIQRVAGPHGRNGE